MEGVVNVCAVTVAHADIAVGLGCAHEHIKSSNPHQASTFPSISTLQSSPLTTRSYTSCTTSSSTTSFPSATNFPFTTSTSLFQNSPLVSSRASLTTTSNAFPPSLASPPPASPPSLSPAPPTTLSPTGPVMPTYHSLSHPSPLAFATSGPLRKKRE